MILKRIIYPARDLILSNIIYKSVLRKPLKLISTSTLLLQYNDSNYKNKALQNLEVINYCQEKGLLMPETITESQYKFLQNQNFGRQLTYLYYLFIRENNKKTRKRKREKLKEYKNLKKEKEKQKYENNLNNSLFVKPDKKIILDLYHHHLASAMMHNQAIVIDLGFEYNMSKKETISLAAQLNWCIAYNRKRCNCFNLTLCNVNFESEPIVLLKNSMPSIFKENFPLNITTQTYLDLYLRKKLVYLTPDADDELTHLDSEYVYIIGGIVECGRKPIYPFTMMKAKEEGIKTMKFPLDRLDPQFELTLFFLKYFLRTR